MSSTCIVYVQYIQCKDCKLKILFIYNIRLFAFACIDVLSIFEYSTSCYVHYSVFTNYNNILYLYCTLPLRPLHLLVIAAVFVPLNVNNLNDSHPLILII